MKYGSQLIFLRRFHIHKEKLSKISLKAEKFHETHLVAQISKLSVVKSRLFLSQLRKSDGIIQIKDEIRQCLWHASISITSHDFY